jgi:deoxyribodipyrimidine photolyase-related protein
MISKPQILPKPHDHWLCQILNLLTIVLRTMPKLDQPKSTLVVILGDQLSLRISSLRRAEKATSIVLMAEVMAEATYARHHKKKLVLVFSAMRHFAEELRQEGWTVDYIKLDDIDNTQSLPSEIERAKTRHGIFDVIMTEAGEWRLRELLAPYDPVEDDRFICSHATFRAWASGRKELRMEYFYRDMRRKTGLLMADGEPEGGRWNFDAENRKPADGALLLPAPHQEKPDAITREVLTLVASKFPKSFGQAEPFWFAVTRDGAETVLKYFLQKILRQFGDTQDAMLKDHRFLNHSLLSAYINIGLLDPLDVCQRVEAEYKKGRVPLASAEGFIRQIIGWREYVRGIYWLKMPDYRTVNALNATRPLPDFYWTAETDMNCIHHAVQQTKEEAYAHHIQRLMVTGNFALLAGLNPFEVHEWYLAVYIDAFEWVELPNTVGMALHADGGLLGSKPYAASGAYINRMSDYCGSCRYDVKKRTGEGACPFNALYWNFIATHQDRFRRNPRMAQMVSTYGKFADDEKQRIKNSADAFLKSISAPSKLTW